MPSPILKIENLSVAYHYGKRWLDAVRDVSFQIEPGETYGLVGESGSGKTTIANAIMSYLGKNGRIREGTIEFAGKDLSTLNQNEMRQIWGAQMNLVPQNPLSSLNPSIRIGEQLAETLRHHESLKPTAAQSRALELIEMVRLPDPKRVANSYPHQISGGMQQRILIAMALSTSPRLLVLDEPTTSLDVTTQASILDLFRDLIKDSQTGVLYVTHNLGVVAQICDRVAVLYAGELVENAALNDVFQQPLHPYTRGLLDSVPRLGQRKTHGDLQAIRGQIPTLGDRPEGCVFEPRCPHARKLCLERPPLYAPIEGRVARCHRVSEALQNHWADEAPRQNEQGAIQAYQSKPTPSGRPEAVETPVLSLSDVTVHFAIQRSLGELLTRQDTRKVKAVEKVNLAISRGKTLGLVGESGSGKTTISRTTVGLTENTGGDIRLLDASLPSRLSNRSLDTLSHLQMVFQNPEEALNPYMTVGESLRRPMKMLAEVSNQEADAEVERLLAAVRLPADYSERMPRQLSGGEKQRIAIARAFAGHPDLLIADEPVSSLDVSVQASILNLLNQLQTEHQSAMLFISHDLAVVGYLADEIAVIYLGHLMEAAKADDLFEPPYHPYTEALLSAIPLMEPETHFKAIHLEGDIPSSTEVPSGCPFHTRCPRLLGTICKEQSPPWHIDEISGKRSFCHIPLAELLAVQEKITPHHQSKLKS